MKSNHALILNRLVEMQQVPYYSCVREELALAESTIVQLERKLAACREDAEQYRWLRDAPPHSVRWARWKIEVWRGGAWEPLRGVALDTAIAAARKGEGE